MIKYELYCDGSTKTNPGIGAWAAILKTCGREIIYTKTYELTTNNRMELLGIIEPLEKIADSSGWGKEDQVSVHIYSDSRYALDALFKYFNGWVKNGWRTSSGKPVKNIDLLIRANKVLHMLKWCAHTWVKGHADNEYNNRCDVLARDRLVEEHKYVDREYVGGVDKTPELVI